MKRILKIIKFVIKENPVVFIITTLSAVIESILPFTVIVAIGIIVNELISHDNKSVFQTVLITIGILLAGELVRVVIEREYQIKRIRFEEQIRFKMYKGILNISYKLFSSDNIQERIRKAENSYMYNGGMSLMLDSLRDAEEAFISFVIGTISFIVFFAMEDFNDKEQYILIGVLLLLTGVILETGIMVVFTNHFSRQSREKFDEILKGESVLSYYLFNVFNDYSSGKSVRLNKMQDLIMHRYEETFIPSIGENLELLKINAYLRIAQRIIARITSASMYAIVGVMAIYGRVSIGMTVFSIGALNVINAAVERIVNNVEIIDRQINQIEEYVFFTDNLHSINENDKDIDAYQKRDFSIIELNNVSFKYDNSEHWALKNINLDLDTNKVYSVVGKNGSGKSTLIKLITGLIEPLEGEIVIKSRDHFCDGVEPSIFNVVFQDFNLYAFTVGENIVCDTIYDSEEVNYYLKRLDIQNDINTFPDGLNTMLFSYDEKGVELSGGEMQKVAIARAAFKNAEIWIMDEPTSALDVKSEMEIYDAVKKAIGDKMCIFVTHRMSSCKFSDSIIVLDGGHVIAQGTHDELLSTCTVYKEMWDEQKELLS